VAGVFRKDATMTDETGIRSLVAAMRGMQVLICCGDQAAADRAQKQLQHLFAITRGMEDVPVAFPRIRVLTVTQGSIVVQLSPSYPVVTGGSHIVPVLQRAKETVG
jgi:hypothetical protein